MTTNEIDTYPFYSSNPGPARENRHETDNDVK